MNHSLRFLPEVAGDIAAGSGWCEERSPGLGEDFARMVYARSDEISRSPLACALVAGRYRRALLRRFPYFIYYVVEGDEILVVGLFHSARRPATTAAALEDRAGRGPDQE
jgi:plasmid stabilization system protein ParE